MPVVVLAPLAAIIVAILALLLILAAAYVAKFVARILPTDIPIIGGSIRSFVENAANSAIAALTATFDAVLHPLVTLILAPLTVINTLFDQAITFGQSLQRTVTSVVETTVPRALDTAKSYADTQAANVATLAHQLVDSAIVHLTDTINTLDTDLSGAIGDARSYAHDLVDSLSVHLQDALNTVATDAAAAISTAEHIAAAALTTAIAALSGSIDMLRGDTDTAIAAARAAITTGVAEAITTAQTLAADAQAAAIAATDIAVTTGLSVVWPDVIDGIDDVIGVAGTDFPDITAELGRLARTIPADVAGAAALAGIATATLTRYLKDCGLPNCRNLSTLGRDLQALLGLVGDAGFLALVIGLATDPQATATEVDDVLGPLARSTSDAMAHLAGVA